MAKIEVWSKDVGGHKLEFLGDPQHLYLIYTNDSGNREILRGGPSNDIPAFSSDYLKIVNQVYEYNSVSKESKLYDWNDGTHIGKTIMEGNEANLSKVWDKMWQKGQEIDAQRYDYDALVQNSNTAVIQLSKEVGLDEEVVAFIKTNSLLAFAYRAELEHTLIIREYDLYDALIDGIELKYGSVDQFKDILQEKHVNPYVWLYLISKALDRSLKDLLTSKVRELMKKLLGNVDTKKPVAVLVEAKTGRNEIFIDQLTGELFDRVTFVDLIQSGKYPGYTVASIDGLTTPMSKPDGVLFNNLG